MSETAGQRAYGLYCEALAHAQVHRHGATHGAPPVWAFLDPDERDAWCAVGLCLDERAEAPVATAGGTP